MTIEETKNQLFKKFPTITFGSHKVDGRWRYMATVRTVHNYARFPVNNHTATLLKYLS